MSAIRILSERLLLFGFWLSRVTLIALGIAILAGAVAVGGLLTWMGEFGGHPLQANDTSGLSRLPIAWIQSVGALFLATGVLLFVVRLWVRIPRTPVPAAEPGSPAWLPLIPVFLLTQAAAATYLSADLLGLWRMAIPALERAGVFQALQRGADPFAGLVIFPVGVVLFVPLVEAAAALSLILAPVLLLILFLTRSRLFPKGMVLVGITQAALVGGSLLAAHAFSLLAARLLALGATDTSAETRTVLAGARQIQDVIGPTARAYAWLLPASLIWTPLLAFSRRLAPVFTNGSFERERAAATPTGTLVDEHNPA